MGSSNNQRPHSVDQVIDWVENGKVSPAEAFLLFKELEKTRGVREAKDSGGPGGAAVRAARDGRESRNDKVDRDRQLAAALAELDGLIGLDKVKKLVKELRAFVEIQQRRLEKGLATEPLVLHMVFKGNPGTGKTTVARILGKIFREMGVLEKGHLVEVERADLVGEYIGHTAQKTREQIRRAMGGILFIDEAYSLSRGGEKDFGKEAIDTMVKAMEDHKNNIILILAGYRREMSNFIRSNPGLRSRFPLHLDFPDYTVEELLAIAEVMLSERQYRLTGSAREELRVLLSDSGNSHRLNTGNARLIRNIIEKAIRLQAVRLVDKPSTTREELMDITAEEVRGILES